MDAEMQKIIREACAAIERDPHVEASCDCARCSEVRERAFAPVLNAQHALSTGPIAEALGHPRGAYVGSRYLEDEVRALLAHTVRGPGGVIEGVASDGRTLWQLHVVAESVDAPISNGTMSLRFRPR